MKTQNQHANETLFVCLRARISPLFASPRMKYGPCSFQLGLGSTQSEESPVVQNTFTHKHGGLKLSKALQGTLSLI